jgi:hypothetical protein
MPVVSMGRAQNAGCGRLMSRHLRDGAWSKYNIENSDGKFHDVTGPLLYENVVSYYKSAFCAI